MSSEQGKTALNSSQKENDDLSLPFWIFLWSLLAIFAGIIYSKLNRQRDVESEVKSDVQHTTNDKQIARNLVNEISKKDLERKPVFRRQRSYEIIDGEVRIHYDVALLEDSLHKRANIDRILKSSEVESIPIRSTSLDDLELVYPGNLPRIVEEGEEEILESQSEEQVPRDHVYINEGNTDVNKCLEESKGKETQVITTKISDQVNYYENPSNFEANGLHSEEKRDDFIATNFETITQETLIPAGSINDANEITINPQKDNCTEFYNHQGETDLKDVTNEMNLNENSSSSDELISTSGESVIENLSSHTASTNSLHNANTASTSVYKLTEIEKTQEHKYTVARREVTKLKSSKEYLVEPDLLKDETSFPFIETSLETGVKGVKGVNGSQFSRVLEMDSSILQPDMQIKKPESDSGKLDGSVVAAIEVDNFPFQKAGDSAFDSNEQLEQQKLYNSQEEPPKHEHPVGKLSPADGNEDSNTSLDHKLLKETFPSNSDSLWLDPNKHTSHELRNEDVNKRSESSLQESCVLTCLEEGGDILVDNSGDILFKVIGPSVEDQYLDNMAENDDITCKNNNTGEFVVDENYNYERFGVKNELAKNWKSLPSWDGVHSIKDTKLDSSSSEIDNLQNIMVDNGNVEEDVDNSIDVENNDLEPLFNKLSDFDIVAVNSDFKDTANDQSNADELVYNEDINKDDLLMLDNQIGSRKTIFVKDAKNEEHGQSFVEETRFDNSNTTMDEEAALFDENTRAELLESKISDKIVIAQPFENNDVEARCAVSDQLGASNNAELLARADVTEDEGPGDDLASSCKSEIILTNPEADSNESTGKNVLTDSEDVIKLVAVESIFTQPDFADTEDCLAKASVQEENVLVAKIITMNESERDAEYLLSSEQNHAAKYLRAFNTESTKQNCIKKSEADVNTPSDIQELNSTVNIDTDAPTTQNNLVHSDTTHGDFNTLTTTITTNTTHTVTKVIHTKVYSTVKKFEEAGKHGACTKNNCLNSDTYGAPEANEPELVDQIFEQTSVSNIGESEKVRSPDINCVVDNRPFSEQGCLTVVDKSKQPNASHDIDLNSDSIELRQHLPAVTNLMGNMNKADEIGELNLHSEEYSGDQSELRSDAETKNIEEVVEEAALYGNRVTELEVSPCDDFSEEYEINDTEELISARPVVAMPWDLTEVSKTDEGVIYANQVCESEGSALIADNYANQPNDSSNNASGNKDDCITTVVYASHAYESDMTENLFCETDNQSKTVDNGSTQNGKENSSTTVIYTNQFNEIEETPQEVAENTNSVDTMTTTPNVFNDDEQNSQKDSPNPSPILPQLNNENGSFMETSFDSPPCPSPGKKFPDLQQVSSLPSPDLNSTPSNYLPRGETDVDYFSDIDEIDIDILPEENYQKSKSVTDLDEALASFEGLDEDYITGGLSKSVPDILDSCREEILRDIVTNPENLQKKSLSLSTPEITSKTKPGSKKVTKIKIVHVKFLEMQEDGGSVEEDSFIYEGELPITGKMKRSSRHLSEELSSPVASPPPDVSNEIAQERWIAEKTSLKQLEFEFGDLFQNSPSPPPSLAPNETSTDGPNQSSKTGEAKEISKVQNASMVYFENKSSYETASRVSKSDIPSSTLVSRNSPVVQSSVQKPLSAETDCITFGSNTANTTSTTDSTKFKYNNQRVKTTHDIASTTAYQQTSTAASYCSKDTTLDVENPGEETISELPIITKSNSTTKTPHQNLGIFRSSANVSSGTIKYQNVIQTKSRVEYQNKDSPSPISSVSASHRSTDSKSYRYIPGNANSYSKVPKAVPEDAKYVVKSGMIATQSATKHTNTRDITTQAPYSGIPSSPQHVTTQAPYRNNPSSPQRVTTQAPSASQHVTTQAPYRDSSSSPRRVVTQFTETSNSSQKITTQVRYTDSPNPSSPTSSPRHGVKLTEKFRITEKTDFGEIPGLVPNHDGSRLAGSQTDTNQDDGHVVPIHQTDGTKAKRSNHRGSTTKATSRHSGRLVTVKGGIISDYECSSDADSEMSYNVPSPRVKAKRFHRPQVHRVDSASSSEPDSPRRGWTNDERRNMSELFGVGEVSQYSSDASKDGRESGSQSSLQDQKLFARFGNLGESDESITRQNVTLVETKSSSANIYQAKAIIYDQKQRDLTNPHHTNTSEIFQQPYQTKPTTLYRKPTEQEARVYHPPRYTSALERNLSPTSFLQEGNLDSDDQTSSRTIEFNPFEDLEGRDGLQPFERCHSPSSVYSDTSSVFSFNCDFDAMPPPTGKFEPEVYTCENPMCRKQDILLGPEKTCFKSCPACFTYYCSSECRKLHWPSHKQSCYFGRVNTYVRSIIRLCQRREDLSMYLSQLARDGYKKKGRGVVMAIFNSPEVAREFITKGHDAFSGRKPTYSSLAELNREGIISKHRVALMQAVRDYEPNEEFVFNIAVVATSTVPIAPAPRYKLNTVLNCIKMPLNDLIVARQPRDYEKVETRLFALPKCSRHEFVNEMEARRHYCRNLSKNLRQYSIKLKDDYPECYKRLCMYVEHNISFEPMTVYGQRSGLNYKCVISPEQSYPLNAQYC